MEKDPFNIDMSAAVENLLLEADALGLGAVWMGISPDQGRMEAVAKVLNLPEELHAFALVPCGIRQRKDRRKIAMIRHGCTTWGKRSSEKYHIKRGKLKRVFSWKRIWEDTFFVVEM